MPGYPPYQTPIVDPNRSVTRPWQLFFASLVSGTGGGAPSTAAYVLTVANGFLPNGEVAADSTTITINTTTPNIISWERAALTGDITAAANSNATVLSNTGVTANTYGDSTHVGQFTVDAKGRLTAASNVAISAASGYVQKTTASLTNGDIIAINATPFTIAAALGANIVLLPLFFVLKAYTSAGAYSGLTDGAFLQIRYTTGPELISGYIPNDSTTTPAITRLTDLLGTTTNKILKLNTPFSEQTDPLSNEWGNLDFSNTLGVANSALRIEGSGFAGALGGGNAANHLDIDTYYVAVSV